MAETKINASQTTITAGDVGAATAAQGAKADTAVQPGDLATVATTGSYSDLTNKPTIPAAQVNSDWDSTSGISEILNKPTLATVATTGAYSDLTGKPTIPNAIQVSTMPTAAASEEGKIYQFIGTTDANYTNGYFYKCVSDGQDPATYSWTAVQVQAGGGGSSYTAGTGIDITSDVISVQNPVIVATDATIAAPSTDSTNGLAIGNRAFAGKLFGDGDDTLAIGNFASATGNSALAIGHGATSLSVGLAIGKGARGQTGVAIGHNVTAGYNGVIIGANSGSTITGTNQAFDIILDSVKYNLVAAGGGLVPDRLASTTGLADGNYRLRLTMASGVPTLSWVAE